MPTNDQINPDGFFGSAALAPAIDPNADDVDLFARAIAGRFSSPDKTRLTTCLSPTTEGAGPSTPRKPPTALPSATPTPATPLARMSLSQSSPSRISLASPVAPASDFTVATAQTVPDILRTPQVLVLDIRPHSAYSVARLPHAISLSVPSTLLKRPTFTLQKLANMLPSASARTRFQSWSTASRILVYDADSSTLTDGSNLLGLLRKFRTSGYTGDVAWLQGGIQALWRENRHLVDERSLSDDEEEADNGEALRARKLPQAAFQQASTILRPSPGSLTMPASESLSHVSQSTQTTDAPVAKIAPANPFYDNIRQNLELSQGITERIPLRLSPSIASRAQELPFTWLRRIAKTAGQDEGTEALAMQFYRIELGEQRRLQGIMAHHSMQSGQVVEKPNADDSMSDSTKDDKQFPYSIIAGVEKGTKNRYRNIWPFEHSRVRLRDQVNDDYVNASYVQPLGTRRKFIATQGPLPSTFSDFWSVVWQQDVHIILMLTREYEGGSIKCGKYWADGDYGPYRLKCISVSGATDLEDTEARGSAGGFFNAPPNDGADVAASADQQHNYTIRRVFELTHTAQPDLPPRTVTHLQYLGWPDMDVPVNPRSLLRFMFEVDEMADEDAMKNGNTGGLSPILLHCSAGVGRTGAFIMIDAALDGVRREIRKRAMVREVTRSASGSSESDSEGQSEVDVSMDVDSAAPPVRDQGFKPSLPKTVSELSKPSRVTILPPTPRPSSPKKDSLPVPFIQTQARPVATLHIGKSARDDIHVPLVPSHDVPSQQQSAIIPSAGSSHRPSPLANSLLKRRMTRPHMQRPFKSDFTIADADSMFVSPNPNPAFAMDVSSLSKQARDKNSSSGEGTTSSGDKATVSSGSASDGRSTGHLTKPFANFSSTDDGQEPPKRQKHRIVAGSDGTGSGEGVSGSASESSGQTSSNATGSVGGGYSSSSSLGLSKFEGMAVGSPAHSSGSGYSSPVPSRPTISLASRGRHRTPRSKSVQKPSLLAPKPLHLKPQMPELTEDVETNVQSAPRSLSSLGDHQGSTASVRSNLSPSSSFTSSTDTTSLRSMSMSGHTTDTTYDTPLSIHNITRDPSVEKGIGVMSDSSLFDYAQPRELHGDDSPPLLSSLQEPLRQILEDMREQRMSLCQSLRQYVFVHNAIIEGALIVAEQELKHLRIDPREVFDPDSPSPSTEQQRQKSMVSATGKRGASPTELPKEDKKGEVALNKRPSVKRGHSPSGGESSSPTSH